MSNLPQVPRPQPSNGLGVAGFVISLLAIFTLFLLSPIGLLISFFALFKRPRGFAFAGFILGLMGTIVMALVLSFFGLIALSVFKYGKPMFDTVITIEQLHRKINTGAGAGAGLPDDLSGNIVISSSTDGWGRVMQYHRINEYSYTIRSAGKDGIFQTDDDDLETFDLAPER